jgi:hypothetical protein
MRGVAAGVFGGATVSAAITEIGNARIVAAIAPTNDPNSVSAGDLFMEGIDHDRPAAAATAGGNIGGRHQRFPYEAYISHGNISGIGIMPDIYSCPTDEVLI